MKEGNVVLCVDRGKCSTVCGPGVSNVGEKCSSVCGPGVSNEKGKCSTVCESGIEKKLCSKKVRYFNDHRFHRCLKTHWFINTLVLLGTP